MTLFDPPPHLPIDAPEAIDEEAERVISALAAVLGKPRWRVDGDRTAEWLANRWRQAQATIAEIDAMADEYHDRINAWRQARTAEPERTIEWATAHLTDYLRRLNEADEKVKSRKLPSATIASKAGADHWTILAEVFVPWALENAPELIKMTPVLADTKRTLVRKDDQAITEDGEVVPGVIVEDGVRSFRVDPAK